MMERARNTDRDRQVTIAGTRGSVAKEEEMVPILSTNPHMDGHVLLERAKRWIHRDTYSGSLSYQQVNDDGRGDG